LYQDQADPYLSSKSEVLKYINFYSERNINQQRTNQIGFFTRSIAIMEGIFGILKVSEWLAILRIGVGLWWLKSFLHKPHREFVNGQMANWTMALADNKLSETYGK
jgi:hypothetical protein